jgi:hypothetical protein
VHTVAVGMPLTSSSTESWTLHDVQEPQSPTPLTTAWQRLESSSSTPS